MFQRQNNPAMHQFGFKKTKMYAKMLYFAKFSVCTNARDALALNKPNENVDDDDDGNEEV